MSKDLPLQDTKPHLPFWQERVVNLRGREIVRIRSSIFYYGGLISIVLGLVLISYKEQSGGFLIINSTVLFLYPLVRFLFGGKDSLVAFIVTIVFDQFLKHKLLSIQIRKVGGGR